MKMVQAPKVETLHYSMVRNFVPSRKSFITKFGSPTVLQRGNKLAENQPQRESVREQLMKIKIEQGDRGDLDNKHTRKQQMAILDYYKNQTEAAAFADANEQERPVSNAEGANQKTKSLAVSQAISPASYSQQKLKTTAGACFGNLADASQHDMAASNSRAQQRRPLATEPSEEAVHRVLGLEKKSTLNLSVQDTHHVAGNANNIII